MAKLIVWPARVVVRGLEILVVDAEGTERRIAWAGYARRAGASQTIAEEDKQRVLDALASGMEEVEIQH